MGRAFRRSGIGLVLAVLIGAAPGAAVSAAQTVIPSVVGGARLQAWASLLQTFPPGAPIPFLQPLGLSSQAELAAFIPVAARLELEPRSDLSAEEVRAAAGSYANGLAVRLAAAARTARVLEPGLSDEAAGVPMVARLAPAASDALARGVAGLLAGQAQASLRLQAPIREALLAWSAQAGGAAPAAEPVGPRSPEGARLLRPGTLPRVARRRSEPPSPGVAAPAQALSMPGVGERSDRPRRHEPTSASPAESRDRRQVGDPSIGRHLAAGAAKSGSKDAGRAARPDPAPSASGVQGRALASGPPLRRERMPRIRSALLVLAHPDDETMLGGTLGRLREAGVEVHAVYLTRGEGGTDLIWEEEIAGLAARAAIDLQGKPAWTLPPTHPLVAEHPAPDLALLRAVEMAEAARRYGLASVLQLDGPDDWSDELERGVSDRWDLEALGKAVSAFAARVRPDLVITLLPDHPSIHEHHRAAGRLTRELKARGLLGPRASSVYAIEETDWYPPGTFAPRGGRITFQRDRTSKALGGTYGDFQWRGAQAHRSQAPGRAGVRLSQEVFVPLSTPGRGRSPFEALLTGEPSGLDAPLPKR